MLLMSSNGCMISPISASYDEDGKWRERTVSGLRTTNIVYITCQAYYWNPKSVRRLSWYRHILFTGHFDKYIHATTANSIFFDSL
jgi:hypothetical protein